MQTPVMNERQLEFWRALCAPFDHKVRRGSNGRDLDFISARQLYNRLDDVCGPSGWKIMFRPTERGIIARLSILAPKGADEWEWIAKEDGGGYAGMQQQGETNEEDDFKSGFSDAAKRAAVVFGIGRYLYKDGIPNWLSGDAAPRRSPHSESSGSQPSTTTPQSRSSQSNNQIRLPASNRQLYPFLKNLEERYRVDIVPRVNAYAKSKNYPFKTTDLSAEQVADVVERVCEVVRALDNYDGALDDATSPDPDLARAKQDLLKVVEALLSREKRRAPTPEEVRQVIIDCSPGAADKAGATGQVLENLSACNDAVWIKAILDEVNLVYQIGDDIPF